MVSTDDVEQQNLQVVNCDIKMERINGIVCILNWAILFYWHLFIIYYFFYWQLFRQHDGRLLRISRKAWGHVSLLLLIVN